MPSVRILSKSWNVSLCCLGCLYFYFVWFVPICEISCSKKSNSMFLSALRADSHVMSEQRINRSNLFKSYKSWNVSLCCLCCRYYYFVWFVPICEISCSIKSNSECYPWSPSTVKLEKKSWHLARNIVKLFVII